MLPQGNCAMPKLFTSV